MHSERVQGAAVWAREVGHREAGHLADHQRKRKEDLGKRECSESGLLGWKVECPRAGAEECSRE